MADPGRPLDEAGRWSPRSGSTSPSSASSPARSSRGRRRRRGPASRSGTTPAPCPSPTATTSAARCATAAATGTARARRCAASATPSPRRSTAEPYDPDTVAAILARETALDELCRPWRRTLLGRRSSRMSAEERAAYAEALRDRRRHGRVSTVGTAGADAGGPGARAKLTRLRPASLGAL